MSPPLRIALVHAVSSHFYGSERVMLDVLAELMREGSDVTVILPESGPFLEKVQATGAPIRILDFRLGNRRIPNRTWLAPFKVAAELRRLRVDLIHCSSLSPLPSFLPAARLMGIPLVAQAQTPYSLYDIRRSFCRKADLLLPVSEACSKPLNEYLGQEKSAKQIRILSPIIREPDTGAVERGLALRDRLGIASGEILLGYLGQLIPRKGVDLILQALGLLGKRRPEQRLLLVGDDPAPGAPTLAALRTLASDLSLTSPIFTGFADDPSAHLAAMDILIMPSRQEGLGMVAGEAMLADCGVIATGVGGIPELVLNRRTGLLIPPEDPVALAEAIETLCDDKDLRQRLAAAGAERARKLHSVGCFGAELRAAHLQAISS